MCIKLRIIVVLIIFLFSCAHQSVNQNREVAGRLDKLSLPNKGVEVSTRKILPLGYFPNQIDGAAVDKAGNLYVGNFEQAGVIGFKVNPLNNKTEFKKLLQLPQDGVVSSIRIDTKNQMFVLDYVNHRIFKFDLNDKTPFTSEKIKKSLYFEDTLNRLFQPNDMAIADDGTLYLTDPPWGNIKNIRQQPEEAWPNGKVSGRVWKLGPCTQSPCSDSLEVLVSNIKTPNGIALSANNVFLFFTDSASGLLYSYDLINKSLQKIFKFNAWSPDGIRLDQAGNIFVTLITEGRIDVVASQESDKLISSIKLIGAQPSNLAFGGHDGKSVFVTIKNKQESFVETFLTTAPGLDWVKPD